MGGDSMKFFALCFAVVLSGASSFAFAQNPNGEPEKIEFYEYKGKAILRVEVKPDASIFAEKKLVTLVVLESLFGRLKRASGSIWYTRQPPPTPESGVADGGVIDLVLKHDIPICLSETPDYKSCQK
jgi:hypothetical protein